MSGDIKLNVGSDLVSSLGCNDLTTGEMVTLLLGQTKICCRIPYPIQDYQRLSRYKQMDVLLS